MKKVIVACVLASLVATSSAVAQHQYGWTISASQTDPHANTGGIAAGGLGHLYLWYMCSVGGGMSAADFGLQSTGVIFAGFSPLSGFLNAGSGSNLLLAVGGCPTGPVVAGDITVFYFGGAGSMCIVNSTNNIRVTVDCESPSPLAWNLHAVGWDALGTPSCSEPLCSSPCSPVLTVGSGSTYVYRDCPAQVPITITDSCDLGAFQFDMPFDDATLDFTSAALGPFLGSTGRNVLAVGPHVLLGRVSYGAISFGGAAGPTGAGNLATLTFTNRNGGSTPISESLDLQAIEVLNTSGVPVTALSTPGTVNLRNSIYADFDANCEVTVTDLMQIATRWGAVSGDSRYNALYDIDLVTPGDFCASAPDGDIDIVDIQLGASRWAATCASAPAWLATSSIVTPAPVSFALDPDVVAGAVGQIATVGIRASGAQDLGAFEAQLAFDSDVVEVVGIRSGGFLEHGQNTAVPLMAPRGDGVQAVSAFSFGSAEGADGEGIVAYVDLRLKTCGESALRIKDARGVTKAGAECPRGQTQNGEIVCATGIEATAGTAPRGLQIAPNPFASRTTVSFALAAQEHVLVAVFDIGGRRVRELADNELATGVHALAWDGRDDAGRVVPAGIYFVRVTGPVTRHTEKVVVSR
ncbi:MAG: FlgD immunoglobulin-like domain containing protein [bacterium]